jgi:regulator of sigma E protease
MTLLHTLLSFLLAIGVLVIVHEFGHFWVARRMGVKVLAFSVGFGRPLLVKRGKDGMEWRLSAFPFGGYVKMLDEREVPVAPDEAGLAFNRQPVGRRIAIVAAGPAANFLLAIALYWMLFLSGIPGLKPQLAEPPANTPAARAGLVLGDEIVAVDGDPTPTWQELRWVLTRKLLDDRPARLQVKTGGDIVAVRHLDLSGFSAADLDRDIMAKLGLKLNEPPIPPVIGQLAAGGVAESSGLRPGDRVVSVSGESIDEWPQLVDRIKRHPGIKLTIEIERDGLRKTLALTPAVVQERGETMGRIGAAPQLPENLFKPLLTEARYGPLQSLFRAAAKTWETSVFSLEMLGRMLLGQVSLSNLSGPVTIADYAGKSAQLGMGPYIGFLALVSVSLGVLNLLPIPLLDGGHLMYYCAEIVIGRPVPDQVMEIGARIGMAILFTLMAFALYNDLTRILTG